MCVFLCDVCMVMEILKHGDVGRYSLRAYG